MPPTVEGVQVYACGPVSLSCCAPKEMPLDEVATAVNLAEPTGISSPWRLSLEDAFASGEPHPSPCNTFPDDRLHYLFHC